MPRIKISSDRMIEELNKAYKKEPDADPANPFEESPRGATGRAILGYTTQHLWSAAHQRAHNAVSNEFELNVDDE